MCKPEKCYGLRSGFELGNLDNQGWCECMHFTHPLLSSVFLNCRMGVIIPPGVILRITWDLDIQSLKHGLAQSKGTPKLLVCYWPIPTCTWTFSMSSYFCTDSDKHLDFAYAVANGRRDDRREWSLNTLWVPSAVAGS